jgi:phosphoserine phosphatase
MEIASDMPLVPGVTEAVQQLKEKDYIVGIISTSYQFVTGIVSKKTGVDFDLACELQFLGNHVTGEVEIPSYFYRTPNSTCRHEVCKSNALHHICREYNSSIENAIVIGGNQDDDCMLSKAGTGLAFSVTTGTEKDTAEPKLHQPLLSKILLQVP